MSSIRDGAGRLTSDLSTPNRFSSPTPLATDWVLAIPYHFQKRLNHEFIKTRRDLVELCDRLRESTWIAFDTEFVSEFTYYPNLCLIQVAADTAAGQTIAVIDPQAIEDIGPFWQTLVEGDHQTIVHAGREEYRFCRRAVQAVPKKWFDIQLAAGMAGLEYPASYGKLVSRLLRHKVHKGETRSDWRRRPLSKAQIEYALQDVLHLRSLASTLAGKLREQGRSDWMREETDLWMSRIEESESQQKWRRLGGLSGLSPNALRIARALWQWREEHAQLKDTLPRRILRDDLLVELARRGRSNPQEILSIRGMEYRGTRNHVEEIGVCIERAAADTSDLPQSVSWALPPQANILEKFLNTALTMICRQAAIAPGLVGTTQDVRELLSFELGLAPTNQPPSLACGWRAKLVGSQIAELLRGNASLRIVDPMSDAPISVSPVE